MNEWSTECIKRCEIELLLQPHAHFVVRTRPHESKAAMKPSVFKESDAKLRSRYSLIKIWQHKHDHSNPKLLWQLFHIFFYVKSLSLESGAHFAGLIFQKCSEHVRFHDVKPSSRYSRMS